MKGVKPKGGPQIQIKGMTRMFALGVHLAYDNIVRVAAVAASNFVEWVTKLRACNHLELAEWPEKGLFFLRAELGKLLNTVGLVGFDLGYIRSCNPEDTTRSMSGKK